MNNQLGTSSVYPSTWGEVYAIFAGRLEGVIDDHLAGDIDGAGALTRWMTARDELERHCSLLAAEGAKAEYDRLRRYKPAS